MQDKSKRYSIRPSLETAILSSLVKQPDMAYIAQIRRRIGTDTDIHSIIDRMVRKRWISHAGWAELPGGAPRKLYAITAAGKKALAARLEMDKQYAD